MKVVWIVLGAGVVWYLCRQMNIVTPTMARGMPVGSNDAGGSLTLRFGKGFTASGTFDSGGHADIMGDK